MSRGHKKSGEEEVGQKIRHRQKFEKKSNLIIILCTYAGTCAGLSDGLAVCSKTILLYLTFGLSRRAKTFNNRLLPVYIYLKLALRSQ